VSNPARNIRWRRVFAIPQDIEKDEKAAHTRISKPTPASKPLKPKQCPALKVQMFIYRNICCHRSGMVLLTGAILIPVGVTQDWFADSLFKS
jgi:hypothetical protein